MPLEITVVELDGRTVFQLAGDLDMLGAPVLLATVMDADRGGDDHVALDLAQLSFLDSSGIQALIEVQQTAANCSRVVLINPTAQAVKVLELGGVIQFFELRRDDSSPG